MPPRRRTARQAAGPPLQRRGDFRSFTPPLVPRAKSVTPLCKRLIVDPEVLEARAVVDAVDHQGHALDPRLPAGCLTGLEDDRADIVLGQSSFDLPHQ